MIFCYPGLEAITVYRLAHLLYRLEAPLIPRIITESAHSRPASTSIPGPRSASYFFIDHGTGVVVGQTTEIGDWAALPGRDVGRLSFPTDAEGNLVRGTKRHPTIEDSVVIYANATVLGGKTIVGITRDRLERVDHELRDAARHRDPGNAAVERPRSELHGGFVLDLTNRPATMRNWARPWAMACSRAAISSGVWAACLRAVSIC